MPRGQFKLLQDREVVEEAARLLRQLSFSACHGAHAEGHHVTVAVEPRWQDDYESLWVGIACYAFGHRQVAWEGLPVFLLPAEEKRGGWIAFLDASGKAVVSHLPPGEFRLSTSPQYGCSPGPVALPTRRVGLAAAGVSTHATVRKQGGGSGAAPSELPVYESTDGRILATVFHTHTGKAAVAFETNDESLTGACVRFAFVEASGQVESLAQVDLRPVRGSRQLWEGRWEEFVELREPCTLVFEVLAPEA